jgi:hypothetical protein
VAVPRVKPAPETDLYEPVKRLLTAQGYDVKGEIQGCDVVGVRGDEPPVVVELKRVFGLAVVLQGLDRLAMTDVVYVAVGAWPRQVAESRRLCRRVGLGLIVVTDGRAEVLEDPVPYRPRRDARRVGRLLREHARRVGDPATGGSTRLPIMTAYRQEAIRCLRLLGDGPQPIRSMRATGSVPNAGRILAADYYGWFERVARGTYGLTPAGLVMLAALEPEAVVGVDERP